MPMPREQESNQENVSTSQEARPPVESLSTGRSMFFGEPFDDIEQVTDARSPLWKRVLIWGLLAVLAALVAEATSRGLDLVQGRLENEKYEEKASDPRLGSTIPEAPGAPSEEP